MNTEFTQLLLQAGEWAAGLTLQQANWNPATQSLQIQFHTQAILTNEQREALQSILSAHFAPCNVELSINSPAVLSAPIAAGENGGSKEKGREKPAVEEDKLLFGKRIARAEITKMVDLRDDSGRVTVEGRLISMESKKLKNGADKILLLFHVTDYTNTMLCKVFAFDKAAASLVKSMEEVQKANGYLRIRGQCEYDNFSRELVILAQDIMTVQGDVRRDTAEHKRVELHLHTQMSAMDALTGVKNAIQTAASWGHSAIAITDHGVVQAFPEAYKAGAKNKIKILYGVEGYLKADTAVLPLADQTYVVFDIETTGLKAEQGHILEIGAVKIKDGAVIDRFSTFVNAGVAIPQNIVALTGITEDMVQGAPLTREALTQFSAFSKGCVLVAHNASFDVGFIRTHGERFSISFDQPYADTLMLSRYLLWGMKNHKLNTICEYLGVSLEHHHRAVDDAEATAAVFLKLMERMQCMGLTEIPVYTNEDGEEGRGKRAKLNHIIILASTQAGMKNLYRLVSHAHIDFFHSKPQIPKSLLRMYREGLLLGSACEQGELYQAIIHKKPEEEILEIAQWYDYFEIQPLGNNAFMLREGIVPDEEALRNINRRIVDMGKALHKPVVATGDVHFLNPEDAVYRAILLNEMEYKDAHLQPPLYFKTTDEMLEDFSYLGEEEAMEVVVRAPNRIAESCDTLKPYPDGTYAPKIEDAENILRNMAMSRAYALYGDPLPEIVQKRLDKELNSIIGNGFASLYLMAQRLVKKSMDDGYLVGSRGSVGSSFVATMAGITEVNPLPPHYLCPNCRHSEFDVDRSKYACGVDMPDADCSACGNKYEKAGYEIPFEVFLGFHGDKTPDIDLNFSGEYQSVAHKYTEEMFGDGHAFRAGTISGVQTKTAYGYVLKYLEKMNMTVTRHEIDRLCEGCSGVKRTTGQHPGGIVIVPKENDILEFTPVQYPADQKQKNTITTHFDFHALDDRLVKLDILGHDDPTALKMLNDLTGINPRSIPLDDEDTMSIYSSSERLGIDLTPLSGCEVGSLGIPEFGTSFVRQMLMDTRPTTMEELVRIAGLSHGTDVWLNNAQTLVLNGTATLSQVICTRDDIMNYLMACGCEPSISFKTMESVRKGKGLTDDMKAAMLTQNVPAWFIDSCEKIKYMFPRAHAVAYVMMSYRIAYYKVHEPKAFYAVYYTVRADAFDVKYAVGGAARVLQNIRDIEAKGKEASNQETDLLTILEVVYEMNLRGIALLPVDIYKSDAVNFLIEEEGIRAPFNAVGGVGRNAAVAMAQNKGNEKFLSIEDFQSRTGANSAVINALTEAGCFDALPKSNQLSLF